MPETGNQNQKYVQNIRETLLPCFSFASLVLEIDSLMDTSILLRRIDYSFLDTD